MTDHQPHINDGTLALLKHYYGLSPVQIAAIEAYLICTQASPIEAPAKDHQSPLEAPLDCTSAKELEAADTAVEAVRAAADQYHASGFQNEDGNPIIEAMKDDGPKIDVEPLHKVSSSREVRTTADEYGESVTFTLISADDEQHLIERFWQLVISSRNEGGRIFDEKNDETVTDILKQAIGDCFDVQSSPFFHDEDRARHDGPPKLWVQTEQDQRFRDRVAQALYGEIKRHKLDTAAQIKAARAAIKATIRAADREPEQEPTPGIMQALARVRELQRALSFAMLRIIERSPDNYKSVHPDDEKWCESGRIGDEYWFDAAARLIGKDHLHPDTLALIQVLNNDARRALEEAGL